MFSTPGFASRADEITRAYIQAMRRHRIDIIAHPGYGVPVDVKTLAKACADYGVLWEINNKHADTGPEDLARGVGRRAVCDIQRCAQPGACGRAPAAFSLAREAGLGAAKSPM